ncbi:MAG: DNA polymerase IV [Saprospiraceae bacterium]|jgi:DNA polymerase-4|nr:DNA polymerase IV [Saprospiraceae bacterium]MBK7373330.1 DNA polymerase IV [Saprospiraceae bacterium]
MYDRAILHMDLDSFFVSVEVLRNSALKGLPLLIGGSGDRGVVASCSYEARRYGVHSAMPMKMARRLCPDAIILRGDMDAYSEYSRQVTELIEADAPCMEKASIDEFYLDLSGMDRYFGCYQWSLELRQKLLREIGLPISLALSVNKTVSKIGTNEAKPNGTKEVLKGTEKDFLAPLSTSKMPGIGEATYKKLSFMGVRTLKVLSEIPPRLLEREFGKTGKVMWERANAYDPTPVQPYSEAKSISHEQTFGQDTLDLRKIKNIMLSMVEKLGFELRQSQKLCSVVTVKIRYADFNTYTRQVRVAYTSNDRILLRQVYDLFDKLYERRQMIRLIGVKYSGLVHGHYQINLFDDKEEDMNLLNELDHIRNRWGAGAIGRAVNVAKEKEHDNRIMPDKKENAKSPIDPRWAKMTRRWW